MMTCISLPLYLNTRGKIWLLATSFSKQKTQTLKQCTAREHTAYFFSSVFINVDSDYYFTLAKAQ